ncbi:MAG: hypothetical protein KDJ19_00015 [Hyphomicrobiaceae bacterium]|nr:hypothetical protein [Hyphomicrobiaceae bacterium]MCC0023803.1 hypothetical protein [Hyphomicrobiaceae bacterium]
MSETKLPGAPVLAPDGNPVPKRLVMLWEAGIFVWIMLVASALHFAFELSGFQPWVSVFGSVNESSVEHLKLFFWPALIAALVQHAYMRKRVNNFWWAKGVAILVAPIVLLASFYFYLGIALPIYGRGFLWADIGTGALGVLTGNILSYRIMTAPPLGSARRNIGLAIIGVLGLHFATAAYLTPRFFLYENFFGYKYSGDFGILPDYSKYLIFRSPEEYEAIKAAESASASS